MFAPSVFAQSVFTPSVFPPGTVSDVVVVPGLSGSGGVYGGLVAPSTRRRRKEDESLQKDQDTRDIIDIVTILMKENIL